MTSTMVRKSDTGAADAAAAFAAHGGGDSLFGRAASPFAGRYSGPLPDSAPGAWGSISVTSDRRIVATRPPAGIDDGEFTGSLRDDGRFEILGRRNLGRAHWWVHTRGTMALGGDGNLHGATKLGHSFVWRRE